MHISRGDTGRATRFTMKMGIDLHQHVRQGQILKLVVPMLARRFAGAIIMPNTDPPITTAAQARKYQCDTLAVSGPEFRPLMTLYLTDQLDPDELDAANELCGTCDVKYYPFGLTTNSENGVRNPSALWTPGTRPYEVLQRLTDLDRIALFHAADGFDHDGNELDPYDQETHFLHESLPRIRNAHPSLKISLEHLSTMEGMEYMRLYGGSRLGCSITAQHLLLDRRDVHRKGFQPHKFWWPIIQGAAHKEALRAFVAEGHDFVWLGSDSAPHPIGKKETDCCSGGVLMAHAGIELYAEIFDSIDALEKLEAFAALNGPRFFGIEPSDRTITLVREPWTVTETYSIDVAEGEDPRMGTIRPFRLGEPVEWKLAV